MALPKLSPVLLVIITGIAAFFMFLAVLFNIISLASNNWLEVREPSSQLTVNSGLWKTLCITQDESSVPNWHKTVRVLLILPILLVLLITPPFIVGIVLKKGIITLIAVLLTVIQAVIVAVSMLYFTMRSYEASLEENLAWSYVMGWISMMFYGISGGTTALVTAVLFNTRVHTSYHFKI